jgi:hypothetical protein
MKKRSKKELEVIEHNKQLIKSVDAENEEIAEANIKAMNKEIYDTSFAFFDKQLKKYPPEVMKEAVK